MWSVIYRTGSYFVGIARYISYDFLFVEQEFGTYDFTEQANKSALHDSLSWKTKIFYRFDGFSEIGALVAAWLKEKEGQ